MWVRGSSMSPTICEGEIVVGWMVKDTSSLQRSDIITFHPVTNNQETYVKRVIGLPGDTIEAQNDFLFVNGMSDGLSQPGTGTWGPMTVDDDCIFALGDNRAVSIDSRTIGCIPFQQVCAKIVWKSTLLS